MAGDIRVEAAELSEGVVRCLRLENEGLKGKVGISVMDAQVVITPFSLVNFCRLCF